MLSSPQSGTRPAVPPKPEKDKITSSLSATTSMAVSAAEELNSRQTIGTQVNLNMLRKASPSSASRFSKDVLSTAENSQTTTNNSIATTSPKPALPPKPSSSAFKKGNTPQIQKPDSFNTGTTTTDSLISSASGISDPKSHIVSHSQNQTSDQSFKNIPLNATNSVKADQSGTAPVAIIDEFDNLSDLNSPSPVRHKEISSPPSHQHILPMKEKTSTSTNTKFGNFNSHVSVNNVVKGKSYKPLPPIPPPPVFKSGVPKNLHHNNDNRNVFSSSTPSHTVPPPVSPRRATHTNSEVDTKITRTTGLIFQYPNNNNKSNPASSLFTAQQIQQRQGKSASLGRTANPPSVFSNVKKSVTLSRVAPLDLSMNTVKVSPGVHTAPIIGSQNRQSVLSSSSGFHLGHSVSFSPETVPPPPPPRMSSACITAAAVNGALRNDESMESIQSSVSVIPNRESVLDVFEKELESQLESLESFCSAQSQFDPQSPSCSSMTSVNFKEDSSQTSTTTSNTTAASHVNRDPRTHLVHNADTSSSTPSTVELSYLEFVDSRLQSMQNLLENIATLPDTRLNTETGNTSNSAIKKDHVSFDVPNKTIPGMGEYMEMEATTESSSNLRKLTDGDIVTNILLSSKRFEGSIISSRRSEPDVIGAAESATKIVNNNNNVGTSVSVDEKDGTCVDFVELPELKSNNESSTDVEGVPGYPRRSWNLSDYSPSQSDSSSSSSSRSRSRPKQHQRRSCDISSVAESGIGGSARRKQVSSWVDIGEDDLSTGGTLGDEESSEHSLIPSSTEDIESHSLQGKVSRRKRGFVNSLFGSFGKSGSSSSHSSNFPIENRSKFFLDSSNLEPESHQEQRVKDRTQSLPAGNVFEIPRRSHRALSRTSADGTCSHLMKTKNQQEIGPHPNMTSVDGEQVVPIVEASVDSKPTEAQSTIITIVGDSEHSGSARSSVCYDEVLADLDTKQRKAFFVARELLTSERTFVDVLNLLTVDFPLALKLASDTIRLPVIGPNDLDFILGGLPTLKAVNEVLMSELEERISKWKENPKIADIIVKTGPFLKHYSTYVRDFERIVQKMDQCCTKYPTFAKTLKEFEANDRCQKLGLKHYMLKPVQRMPQYRLLLEDYLKTLDETSEDYSDTVKAILIVKEVAEHANEAINLQINAEKLMNLQNRLPNIIVLRTNRFLLKEGELLKVCRKELQPRYFALMTDVLLCMTYNASAGSNVKDLKLRYNLPLAGMRISSKFEDSANEFSVISTTRSFSVVAKTARERDEWMKTLSTAIQDNIKKRTCTTPDIEREFRIGNEAPVWIQDRRVTMCQVCTIEFTLTFRRHHCRACGKCVCSNCSGNQAPLQYLENEAARVCEACYQHLLEEFDRENREKNTDAINEIRMRFKKVAISTTSRANRQRKSIPDKFKVQAINSASRISGYLQLREKKTWKRHWFVLMDRVLYVYAASEDIVANRTIPVLGYKIESVSEEMYPGVDPQLMFRLTHSGVSHPLVFMAENYSSVEKWISALQESTVLT